MIGLLCLFLALLTAQFKSKSRLEAENAALRHQLIVLRLKVPGRVRLTNNDRWFLIQLYRWFPSILHVVTIIQPETLVRWHRTGFRWYWRERRASTANCSNSGLKSRSQASPSTWSSGAGRQVRAGARFCGTMRLTLPPWTCSLSRAFALTCCMHLSLSDWTAEILSGLTSRQTQRLNGSRDS